MAGRLTGAARTALVASLPLWKLTSVRGCDALTRDLRFTDFSSAWAFMTRVALAAEAANHHPEWSNVYSRVNITLTTHDAGGLSDKDGALARAIDRFVAAGDERRGADS